MRLGSFDPVKNNKPGWVEETVLTLAVGVAIGSVGQPKRVGRFGLWPSYNPHCFKIRPLRSDYRPCRL